MKYLEEKKQFSEDYKRAVLEQITKKKTNYGQVGCKGK